MRTFLRLDYLYNQALYHNEKASQWGSRAAVGSLIDILAITTRSDVRSEVLKEIERHLAQLAEFENKSGVDGGRLRALINNLHAAAHGAVGGRRLLPAAAARFGIPGGDQASQRHSRRHLRIRPAGLSSSGSTRMPPAARRPSMNGWRCCARCAMPSPKCCGSRARTAAAARKSPPAAPSPSISNATRRCSCCASACRPAPASIRKSAAAIIAAACVS